MPPVAAATLMPDLRRELEALVAIPSVSGPGRPDAPILAACHEVVRLFEGAGAQVELLELPGTAPIITGGIPAPPGAPTVLLYSHYDVVPAGDEALWDTPPFVATERDGALYGRGTADTKSNILMHVGALRAWEGRPPVGIKLAIEGNEEIGGAAFTPYPAAHPEPFAADAMIIGDAGSVRPGVPTLTVGLRGMANVDVEVRTLASAKHSGLFGGAAPDALVTLIHALSTLHDDRGDVAVGGLMRTPWEGPGPDEAELRELAQIRDGLPLIGTGDLATRLWSGPAITVIGLDAPPVAESINAVIPHARARLNVRVHPAQDPAEAQAAVIAHLQALRPFGVDLTATVGDTGPGFAARTDSPAYEAARAAWSAAWGAPAVEIGVGGSIPVVSALQQAAPQADVLIVGTCDGHANIHAPNERVLLDEFERAVAAEADFLGRYAAAAG